MGCPATHHAKSRRAVLAPLRAPRPPKCWLRQHGGPPSSPPPPPANRATRRPTNRVRDVRQIASAHHRANRARGTSRKSCPRDVAEIVPARCPANRVRAMSRKSCPRDVPQIAPRDVLQIVPRDVLQIASVRCPANRATRDVAQIAATRRSAFRGRKSRPRDAPRVASQIHSRIRLMRDHLARAR